MPRVLGLDVSANRIAWALCDGRGECETGVRKRGKHSVLRFVDSARQDIDKLIFRVADPDAYCLEVNLHPRIVHKGHIAPNMVKAYLRSRWVEGALLHACGLSEPLMITKMKGGFHKIPAGDVFALQASGGKGAKEKRRERMSLHYNLPASTTEDEFDALAVAHETVVALTTGIRDGAK